MTSKKNYVIVFLALTTVVGASLAWRQYQELIQLRAAAMDNGERASLQKLLWDAEKRRHELEDQLAALRAKDEPEGETGPEGEEPGAGNPRGNRRGRGGPNAGFGNFMAAMDRPEIQKLMAIQQKGSLDGRYGELFKNLHLSPEQLDKFKNLLVEKQTSMLDVMAAARAEGINPRTDPSAFRDLVAQTQNEVDNSIKSALGDADYAQYQNYEKTMPQRAVVDQLDQRLSYTSTPLTSEQSDQLVQILANTAAARGTANGAPGVRGAVNLAIGGPGGTVRFIGGGGGSEITNATIEQAQGVLAAPQVDALKQLQQEQQAQQQLGQAMRNQFRNSGAASGTTTAPSTPAAPMAAKSTGGG